MTVNAPCDYCKVRLSKTSLVWACKIQYWVLNFNKQSKRVGLPKANNKDTVCEFSLLCMRRKRQKKWKIIYRNLNEGMAYGQRRSYSTQERTHMLWSSKLDTPLSTRRSTPVSWINDQNGGFYKLIPKMSRTAEPYNSQRSHQTMQGWYD